MESFDLARRGRRERGREQMVHPMSRQGQPTLSRIRRY
jgi:hypothetical protein